MAGCKGLVIIDPESTLEQFYLKIRPSMKKFECDEWNLDICEASQPSIFRLFLSLQLILFPYSSD
jgi:hypothetical protein